jgi:PTS system fructose-specific IIC component
MRLADHIGSRALLPGLTCRSQGEVIARLVDSLGAKGSIRDPQAVLAEVLRREQNDSTTVGGGLAIPHARTDLVDSLQIGIATLARPLAIPAADQQPVDVFVLIVGPVSPARQMIQVLASLARLVKNSDLLADLRRARSAKGMRSALEVAQQRLA